MTMTMSTSASSSSSFACGYTHGYGVVPVDVAGTLFYILARGGLGVTVFCTCRSCAHATNCRAVVLHVHKRKNLVFQVHDSAEPVNGVFPYRVPSGEESDIGVLVRVGCVYHVPIQTFLRHHIGVPDVDEVMTPIVRDIQRVVDGYSVCVKPQGLSDADKKAMLPFGWADSWSKRTLEVADVLVGMHAAV